MSEFYSVIGKRIKYIRVSRGLTREKLAEKAGISAKFLYEIESGKKGFSVFVLFQLAKCLSVNCDFIVCDVEEQNEIEITLQNMTHEHQVALVCILNMIVKYVTQKEKK